MMAIIRAAVYFALFSNLFTGVVGCPSFKSVSHLTYSPQMKLICLFLPENLLLQVEEQPHPLLPSTVELVLAIGQICVVQESDDDG